MYHSFSTTIGGFIQFNSLQFIVVDKFEKVVKLRLSECHPRKHKIMIEVNSLIISKDLSPVIRRIYAIDIVASDVIESIKNHSFDSMVLTSSTPHKVAMHKLAMDNWKIRLDIDTAKQNHEMDMIKLKHKIALSGVHHEMDMIKLTQETKIAMDKSNQETILELKLALARK